MISDEVSETGIKETIRRLHIGDPEDEIVSKYGPSIVLEKFENTKVYIYAFPDKQLQMKVRDRNFLLQVTFRFDSGRLLLSRAKASFFFFRFIDSTPMKNKLAQNQ
jgi:hypothetical protein